MRGIILAAGMGTRLKPLTENCPKGLVEVNGLPMVEREIMYLKESGIEEIIVVTGYLGEKFSYLKEKYGVNLIHNDKYDKYNNIYTMYLVREYLGNSYVLDCDLYLNKNLFDKNIKNSMYCGVNEKNFTNEWILRFDESNKVNEIIVDSAEEDIILRGLSYWTKNDAEIIVEKLEEAIKMRDFTNLYWDDIVKENLDKIDLYVNMLEEGDIFEIDSLDDLEKVNKLVIV